MRGLPNHVKIHVFVSLLPYSFVIVLLLNLLLSIFTKTLDCSLCGFARIIFKISIHPPLGLHTYISIPTSLLGNENWNSSNHSQF